jgi:hypothetical protein
MNRVRLNERLVFDKLVRKHSLFLYFFFIILLCMVTNTVTASLTSSLTMSDRRNCGCGNLCKRATRKAVGLLIIQRSFTS